MGRRMSKFQDWMTIITYAEAGQPEMGFRIAGLKVPWKKETVKETPDAVKLREYQAETAEDIHSVMESTTSSRTDQIPQKKKLEVMVVDDEPIVGKRLKPALSKYGYDVEVFENPIEAMNRFNEKEFDIVVTDLRMEDLDGIGVLEHVLSKSDRTKVIFITGYATVENAREALIKGAFDFIAKPFKINDLRMAITKAALSLGYKGAVAGATA